MHVFVEIYSRFHKPSKTVANWFLALMALIFILNVVGLAVESFVSAFVLVPIIAGFFGVFAVFFGATVYAVSIARAPTDSSVLRATSAEELESRRRVLRFARGIQAICVAILAPAFAAVASGNRQPATIVCAFFVFLLTFVAGCITIVVMGNRRSTRVQQNKVICCFDVFVVSYLCCRWFWTMSSFKSRLDRKTERRSVKL